MSKYQHSRQEQQLTTAVYHCRHAYQTINENHRKYSVVMVDYAVALSLQDLHSGGQGNLQEVIHLLERARQIMNNHWQLEVFRGASDYGMLSNMLGQAYLDHYRESRTSEALELATEAFKQGKHVSVPGSRIHAFSLIGSATTLWTACDLQVKSPSQIAWLRSAIAFLTAVKGQKKDIQGECYRHLAIVYRLLYTRTRDRKDLDLSTDYHRRASLMLGGDVRIAKYQLKPGNIQTVHGRT